MPAARAAAAVDAAGAPMSSGLSANSMFYMAALLIGIYLVGAGIYCGYQAIKKKLEERRDKRYQNEE